MKQTEFLSFFFFKYLVAKLAWNISGKYKDKGGYLCKYPWSISQFLLIKWQLESNFYGLWNIRFDRDEYTCIMVWITNWIANKKFRLSQQEISYYLGIKIYNAFTPYIMSLNTIVVTPPLKLIWLFKICTYQGLPKAG